MIFVFWMLSFKLTFSLSSFTFIKRLFISSSLSAIRVVSKVTQLCLTLCNPMDYSLPGSSVHGIFQARVLEWVAISFSRGPSALQIEALPSEPPGSPIRVVSSAYLRLLIFLLAILIPACASSSPAFLMMYSAYVKQAGWQYIALTYSFYGCSMSSFNCCFLTCIQVSQEACQVVSYSYLFQNCPQFIVIHTVKGFGIVIKAEIDVFLELSCFLNNPVDVGNFVSGSSTVFKSSLNIWKFMVHVLLKPGLENFEHYFTSMWDECDCAVICAFFGMAFLWNWNGNWHFPVLWPLLSFPNLLAYWVQPFHSISLWVLK